LIVCISPEIGYSIQDLRVIVILIELQPKFGLGAVLDVSVGVDIVKPINFKVNTVNYQR